MKSISVESLKTRIKEQDIVVLDVREPWELKIAKISKSISIPMQEIPKRLNKLKRDLNYAVLCHSGVRSYHVATYLEKEGFNVWNVDGGIDRWSLEVDTSIKRY